MKLAPGTTAVLTLDIQEGVVASMPGAEAILPQAAAVVELARTAGFLLLHVGLGFEPGYPEISPRHARFSLLRERGQYVKGSASARIHGAIWKPGDIVVHKHRVSAFSGNALQMILGARGIETLVLCGIATSGIVLSTLRAASDLDFQCVVVKDACCDRDEEVHRVLTEKVFVTQATVVTAAGLRADLAGA
jgi:nicotinamidase-related amidase